MLLKAVGTYEGDELVLLPGSSELYFLGDKGIKSCDFHEFLASLSP